MQVILEKLGLDMTECGNMTPASEIGLADQMTVQVHSQTQIDVVVELMRLFNLIFFLNRS